MSFKINGEIKSFTDKQKLREFSTTKPALQQILKGLTYPVNTRERKDLQKQTQINQENANRNRCINNYLKCKWIKCTNQKIQTAEWIHNQDPYIWCLQETHFRPRDTNRLKVKGRKKIFHEKGNQKKAGVTILISDKMDFKIKNIRQRRALHNDQRINPRRRHNNHKCLCTQHRSTSIHKTKTKT